MKDRPAKEAWPSGWVSSGVFGVRIQDYTVCVGLTPLLPDYVTGNIIRERARGARHAGLRPDVEVACPGRRPHRR